MGFANATVLKATPNQILLSIDEVAGAANTYQMDILGLLTAAGITRGGLFTFASAVYASQAAARTAARPVLRINVRNTAAASGGGAAFPVVGIDENVSGALAGNFRLDLTGIKDNNADTASYQIQVEYRHSVIR